MRPKLLLFLIVLLALFLRIYKIDQVPASLYYDEVDYGYQARSLLETGKDYRGNLSPFYVQSFNDVRTPLPAYLTVISTLVFKSPEYQVRIPFVLSGVLVVVLSFFLVRLLTKNDRISLISAFIFATNPWLIQFSRVSHEVGIMMLVFLLGLIFFFKSLEGKKYLHLIFSSLFLSLSIYTYRTMSLFLPLIVLILVMFFRKDLIFFGFKKLILIFLIMSAVTLPFLFATTFWSPDIPRINQVSIFSEKSFPVQIQRSREVDSGDLSDKTLGKKAIWYSKFFHNKLISWLDIFTNNYLSPFSTQFLFTSGDSNLRHSVGQMGQLLLLDFVALVLGIIFIYKNIGKKTYQFLLLWLLLSPIPAALTFDGAMHAPRLFIFSAPLLITVAMGWHFLFTIIKKLKYARIIAVSLITFWVILFAFYLHRYFVHYRVEGASSFGYGFKQAMEVISSEQSKYNHVYMVSSNDPPVIYYLFWSKTPVKDLQAYGTEFSTDIIKGTKLDKIKVIDFNDLGGKLAYKNNLKEDVLYLLTNKELGEDFKDGGVIPPGVKLIKLIRYPDNVPAFYLITKDATVLSN